MRTLQPKKQAEGGTEHHGKTPQRVEKGNGEALTASPPARRDSKATHGGAAQQWTCCTVVDLLQDAATETPGTQGLKFRDKKGKIKIQRDMKDQALALVQKPLSHNLPAAGGKHRGSITACSFCSSSLPQASAAVGDRIRGQMELGCTRSGRSPEVCLAPARDRPWPRRGNSPRAAPGALRHLCAAHICKRNWNQDTLP